MNSAVVYEHRALFTVLYCHQIVWAILEEGRAYFSQRLSPDNFTLTHPHDIMFPCSMLILMENNICTQTPIQQSSFPSAWMPTAKSAGQQSTTTTHSADCHTCWSHSSFGIVVWKSVHRGGD